MGMEDTVPSLADPPKHECKCRTRCGREIDRNSVSDYFRADECWNGATRGDEVMPALLVMLKLKPPWYLCFAARRSEIQTT